jgi:hypothetical protein
MLTRMVTYSIVFGLGYGFGTQRVLFGVAAGAATGVTVALELAREARGRGHYSLAVEALLSAIRGIAYGFGLSPVVGFRFAMVFAAMATAGQVIAYSRGVRPSLDYHPARRPGLSRKQIHAAIVRTVGYLTAALVCSAFVPMDHPWLFSLQVGLVTGLVTATGNACVPFIEYFSDHLPERTMGAFGIALIFVGFSLQSVQYWLVVLDVPVR